MSNRKRQQTNQQSSRVVLPPIIAEDDGELPFTKQDFFSDVAILSGDRKLYTSRCLLAYNSPVFEKQLGNAKKHELDLQGRSYDDVVELLCYLDPRVEYTITSQSAKQLLPLAEEYEMFKLRRACENVLLTAYEQLRKDHKLGYMPADVNEEYLILADHYKFDTLLQMCVEEYVHCPLADAAKSIVTMDTVSESVKLAILRRKLSRLTQSLDKERKYKHDVESKLEVLSPRRKWTNKFDLY